MRDEEDAFTIDDLNEFLSAKTYAEQFEILLKHSQKNQKIIEIRRKKKMENYNADYNSMAFIDIFSFFFPLFGKTDRAAVLDYNVYNPTSLKIKEQRCSLLLIPNMLLLRFYLLNLSSRQSI